MKKMFYIAVFSVLSMIFSGCGEHIIVNGVSYKILTESEQKEMVQFARLTLIRGEKLTHAQQNYIRNTEPEIRLSYTGDKTGKASYQWICDDAVMVRLNCSGEFLSDNMSVNTKKIKLAERVGKDGKRVLEKLTFKEIEY